MYLITIISIQDHFSTIYHAPYTPSFSFNLAPCACAVTSNLKPQTIFVCFFHKKNQTKISSPPNELTRIVVGISSTNDL